MSSDLYRVVGFEVQTQSVDSGAIKVSPNNVCNIESADKPQSLDAKKTSSKFHMTYEVVWQESDIPWASRWDSYLKMTDVKIHWFSIINSLVVVFFLAGILSMILIRSLRKDIANYNREDEPVSV